MAKREVICIHIGQAGCQVGSAIWEMLTLEQGVKLTGGIARRYLDKGVDNKISAFFIPTDGRRYMPRALFVDTEAMVIDEIRTGSYRKIFQPDCLVSGIEDASNLFPRGLGEPGRTILYPTLDGLRILAESSDTMPSIHIFRSLGGGTGSGYATLFLRELEVESSKLAMSEMVIYPSPDISTTIVEPYNAILTAHQTMYITNLTLIMDNSALYDKCKNNLHIKKPTYFNINRCVTHLFSSLTSSIRFDNDINSDFSILQTNIVPYPGIKFPLTSYAPLVPSGSSHRVNSSIQSVTDEVFHHSNFYLKCFPEYGEYMACALFYRGKDAINGSINLAVYNVRQNDMVKFVKWSPAGFKISISRQAPPNIQYSCIGKVDLSVGMLANNTCLAQVLDFLIQKFDLLYKRRAYIHWYTSEGLEEAEFTEARKAMSKLILDYMDVGSKDVTR